MGGSGNVVEGNYIGSNAGPRSGGNYYSVRISGSNKTVATFAVRGAIKDLGGVGLSVTDQLIVG